MNDVLALEDLRRSPHGERGLKFRVILVGEVSVMSLPSRGAWIEIYGNTRGRCWLWSLPSRGAWIEIPRRPPSMLWITVAPLTGSVD